MSVRMILSLAVASVLTGAASADLTPVTPEPLSVPSGQPVAFYESLLDRPAMGLTARFRFLAPELPRYLETLSYEDLEADLASLCESYALPRLAMPMPTMIVISMAEEPTPFADPDPDVVQVFEAYRPADTHCEWEAF